MSFILDALRKADADRERGHVPSIHAQPILPGAAPAGAARAPRIGLWVALGALLLVVAVGLTWWLVGAAGSRNAPTTVATAPTAPAVVAAAAPLATATPAVPATTDAPKAAAPVAPASTAARAATPKPKPKPAAAAQPAPRATTAGDAGTPPLATAPGGNAPHAGKIYAVAELPDDIRRQLPAVSVGGSMYSPVRANRILIVNGQVLHEGDRIAPDLTLDQVRVKAAVLSFKGYRYLVDF